MIGTAQNQISGVSYKMKHSGDTITNATADTLFIPTAYPFIKTTTSQGGVQAGYKSLNLQVQVKKISGTSAGTAILLRSMDGVTYHSNLGDTLTLSNVSTVQQKNFTIKDSDQQDVYYIIRCIGSGTQTASIIGWFLPRKPY